MRVARSIIPLILLLGMGCHRSVTTAPVPGQLNTFDAYAYRVLYDAQAAINSFKGSQSASNPSVKPVLNQAIADYDIAQSAYKVWYATGGTGPTTPISDAISKVQSDIAAISTAAGGK
jgi:hypothetical protein